MIVIIYDQRQSESEGSLWLDEQKFVSQLTTYRKFGQGWMFEPPDAVTLLFNVADREMAIEQFLRSSTVNADFRVEQIGKFAYNEPGRRGELGT